MKGQARSSKIKPDLFPEPLSRPPLFFLFAALAHLFILLALLPEGVTSGLPQEADGYVEDLLLVEHGERVRLAAALGRAVSYEKGAVLQKEKRRTKMETKCFGKL